jgi:MFS family permease
MNTPGLRAFIERSFLYLWIGEVFTQVSINILNFFLILVVFKLTHSNTAVSGVVLSFTIPAILFGSIAGVYVDHWNKKKVLILTTVIRALLILLMVPFVNNHIAIYIITFLISVVSQFFIPAETPMIPLVVKKSHLLEANALFGLGIFGSVLIAYILSGPLLIFAGQTYTLVILAVLLFIAAGFIALIKVREKDLVKETPQVEEPLHIMKDLKHTMVLMSQTRTISRSLFMLALSQILILLVATIAPGYANSVLGIKVEEFPLLFVAPAAFGMVVGAWAIVRRLKKRSKEKVITVGLFLSALAFMFLPFGSKVASRGFVVQLNTYLPHFLQINILEIMVVVAFILGVANSFIFVPANTILQEQTADEVRGKIYGFLNTIVGILSFLPILLVGGLSDLIGVNVVIIGIGVSLLILAIFRTLAK